MVEAARGSGGGCCLTRGGRRIIFSIELHIRCRPAAGNLEREAVAFVRTNFKLVRGIHLFFRRFPSARDARVTRAAFSAFVNQVDARRRTVRLITNKSISE